MLPKIPQPTLEQISFPEFQIACPSEYQDSPYHHLTFTEPITGGNWWNVLCSVRERNFTLPSAQEFAAFQIATGERKFESGITRTAAMYFKDGRKRYVAFDDTPDPEQNIFLKRMEEGMRVYALSTQAPQNKDKSPHQMGSPWQVPTVDKDVRSFLTRAERDGRICNFDDFRFYHVPQASGNEPSYINPGERQWGGNTLVQAVLGDCAADFASVMFVDAVCGLLQPLSPESLTLLDAKSVAIYGISFTNIKYCIRTGGSDNRMDFNLINIAARLDSKLGTRGIKNPKEWTKAL